MTDPDDKLNPEQREWLLKAMAEIPAELPAQREDVGNITELQQALILLTYTCKTSALQIASLAVEVVALRETVRALDPTFQETFERRNREYQDLVSQKFPDVTALFDNLIQRLKDGEIC
jgi:hypothetical protein